MPTNVTVTTDYGTVASAVAALETGGADEHDFSTDGIATITVSSSFQDTAPVEILAANFTNGSSTSSTAYLKITVDSSNRTPKYDTTKYYMNANPSNNAQLELDLDYTWVEYMQFVLPSLAGNSEECIRFLSGASNCLVEKCVLYNVDGQKDQDLIYAGTYQVTDIFIFDCVLRSKTGARFCIQQQAGSSGGTGSWRIEHCTMDADGGDHCLGGYANGTADPKMHVWNCAAFDSGQDYESTDGGSPAINLVDGARANIASDAYATAEFGTTGNYDNITLKDSDTAGNSFYVTSLTADAEDYQLLEGSTATNTAVDAAVSGATRDSRCDEDYDIAGNARPATYTDRDIGAFEVVSAGGGLSIPVAMHSYRQRHQF